MTIYDWMILCYRIALGALVLCTAAKGTGSMLRTIVVILFVYIVQAGIVSPLLWPRPEWSLAMIAVDGLAAWAIALRPAGRMQALIAYSFLPQIAFHLGRYLNGENADMNLYFWGLTVLGFVQLVLAGSWWLHVRYSRHDRHAHPRPAPDQAHRESVGR